MISVAPHAGWINDDDLGSLKQVTVAIFDVILINALYTEANVPTGLAPTIASFTSNALGSISKGTSVTLNWS